MVQDLEQLKSPPPSFLSSSKRQQTLRMRIVKWITGSGSATERSVVAFLATTTSERCVGLTIATANIQCDRRRPCGRCTALGLTGSCVYEVDEARDP